MGAIQSRKKYVILYGPIGSGKSTLLYSQKSTTRLFQPMEPTKGINYEEVEIDNQSIGVFEISGELKQYNLVNVVTSSVDISGIIFLVPLYELDKLSQAKSQLKLILGNQFFEEDSINLLIIYNMKSSDRERLSWISNDTLDERMELRVIQERFRLKSIQSIIYDCSSNNTDIFDEMSLIRQMKKFIDNTFKETIL